MAGFFPASDLATKAPLPLAPRCGACGLWKGCRSPKMPIWGEGRKRLLVVGEVPAHEDDSAGRVFHERGGEGSLLRGFFGEVGIDLDRDCWATSSLRCRPFRGAIKDEKWIDHCRPFLVGAVRELEPVAVLLLGKRAVQSLIGWLWKESVEALTRWVGWQIPCQRLNCWILPTWHPSHLLREERGREVYDLLYRKHLEALAGIVERGERPWPDGPPDWSSEVAVLIGEGEAVAAVRAMTGGKGLVAFDYETDRLKPDHPDARIVAASLSDGRRTVAFPWLPAVRRAFGDFLASDTPKAVHNLDMECRWSLKEFGRMPRRLVWDSMLAAHALDNRAKTKGLKFQSFVRLGMEAYDGAVKPYLKAPGGNLPNRVREVGLPTLLRYCGLDSLLGWKLARLQMRDMKGENGNIPGAFPGPPRQT